MTVTTKHGDIRGLNKAGRQVYSSAGGKEQAALQIPLQQRTYKFVAERRTSAL